MCPLSSRGHQTSKAPFRTRGRRRGPLRPCNEGAGGSRPSPRGKHRRKKPISGRPACVSFRAPSRARLPRSGSSERPSAWPGTTFSPRSQEPGGQSCSSPRALPTARVYAPYSLTELAAYLRNNSIAFYPVVFGAKEAGDELGYLASESGGKVFQAFAPGGMKDVMTEVSSRLVSHLYHPLLFSNAAAVRGRLHSLRGRSDRAKDKRSGRVGLLRSAESVARGNRAAYALKNALSFSDALAASGA